MENNPIPESQKGNLIAAKVTAEAQLKSEGKLEGLNPEAKEALIEARALKILAAGSLENRMVK